jgi:hypothetical protein
LGWAVKRWPATVALLVCIVLYDVLPETLVLGPRWLVPVLEAIPILFLTFGHPSRHPEEPRAVRFITIATIAVINVFNLASIFTLIDRMLSGHVENGRQLILAAVSVWFTNCVVFGMWFWEIDRGGPALRHTMHEHAPDFQFPQMENPTFATANWMPRYTDYLYLAFTNATAFSPTDAMPLTFRAKALMAIESFASLATIVIVTARAVNILKA